MGIQHAIMESDKRPIMQRGDGGSPAKRPKYGPEESHNVNPEERSGVGAMLDPVGNESMEVEPASGYGTGSYNEQPGPSSSSRSMATSAAVGLTAEEYGLSSNTEMEDSVPPMIDIASQSELMARIRDSKPDRKLASRWDDDDDDDILEKDMNDPKEQVLTAAEHGNLELLKTLISNDPALLSARDSDGYTALHRAAHSGHPVIVEYLMSLGANPEWKTGDGWTVLHCAATWAMHEVVALLLRHGVNVNSRSNGNLTPLHLAVTSAQPQERVLTTVRYLLEAPGIDASAVSNSGEAPLALARRTSGKITEMLLHYFSRP